MKKWYMALGLGLVALILVGVTMVTPWYSISETTGSIERKEMFTLFEVRSEYNDESGSDSDTQGWDVMKTIPETASVFNITLYLIMGAFILLILFIILLYLASTEKLAFKASGIVALGAMLLLIISPLYMMVALPAALEKDRMPEYSESFFGSEGGSDWGGDIGWFAALIAFVVTLVSGFVTLRLKNQKPASPSEYQEDKKKAINEDMG